MVVAKYSGRELREQWVVPRWRHALALFFGSAACVLTSHEPQKTWQYSRGKAGASMYRHGKCCSRCGKWLIAVEEKL